MAKDQVQTKNGNQTLYILLSFGITWLCWIPAILIAEKHGYLLPTPTSFVQFYEEGFENTQHLLVALLFNVAVYGPLIAAIVTIALEAGKNGVKELFRRIVKWRVEVKWYVLILCVTTAIVLVPKLIGLMIGIGGESLLTVSSIPIILLIFLRQVLTSGLGEEPGWRGYLQPKLQTRYSVKKSIWILGAIWSFWHYPFLIYFTVSGIGEAPIIQVVITLILSLAGSFFTLVGITYIYAWVYNNTQSVFIAIIMHALSNFMQALFLGEGSQALSIFSALMPWVAVWVLERIYGKDSFPGENIGMKAAQPQ